jgi:hypothetical protein
MRGEGSAGGIGECLKVGLENRIVFTSLNPAKSRIIPQKVKNVINNVRTPIPRKQEATKPAQTKCMKAIGRQNIDMEPGRYLTHMTLNTRRVELKPLQSLHPLIYSGLVPMLEAGFGAVPALPELTVALSSAGASSRQFSIATDGAEVVAGAVLWGASDELPAWAWLSSLLDDASVFPECRVSQPPLKPEHLPWLGVVLLAPLGSLSAVQAGKLSEFEGLLALAILQHRLSRN